MREFLLFFVLMFVNYGLLCVNYRMVARGSYWGTAATDAAIAALGFTLVQRVAVASTLTAQAGYILGGVSGSMLGLRLTRRGGSDAAVR